MERATGETQTRRDPPPHEGGALEFNDAKNICRISPSVAPEQIKSLTVEVLDAIGKNVEITRKMLNQTILPSLPLLPYPCFVSPWSLLLKPRNPEKPYGASRTMTLISVWTLYEFLFCYRAVAASATTSATASGGGIKLKRDLEAALNMKAEQDEWLRRVNGFLNEFFRRMKNSGVTSHRHKDATRCMYDFSGGLFDHTMEFIHLLERRVHRCVCIVMGNDKIPCYLTRVDKSLIPKPPENEMRDKVLAQETLFMIQWFSQKQLNASAASAKAEANMSSEPPAAKAAGAAGVTPIRTELISKIIETQREDPRCVLGGFIPYATLWEYAKFMDVDRMLE